MNDTLATIVTATGGHWLAYKWGYLGMFGHVMWFLAKQIAHVKNPPAKGARKTTKLKIYEWAFSLMVYWFLIVLWREEGLTMLMGFASDFPKVVSVFEAGPINPMSVPLAFAVHPLISFVFNTLVQPHQDGVHPIVALAMKLFGKK